LCEIAQGTDDHLGIPTSTIPTPSAGDSFRRSRTPRSSRSAAHRDPLQGPCVRFACIVREFLARSSVELPCVASAFLTHVAGDAGESAHLCISRVVYCVLCKLLLLRCFRCCGRGCRLSC